MEDRRSAQPAAPGIAPGPDLMQRSDSDGSLDDLSRAKERLLRRLVDRKGREREALVLVEGHRAVSTALQAGARFRFALVSDRVPFGDVPPEDSEGSGSPADIAGAAQVPGGSDIPPRLREEAAAAARLGAMGVEVIRVPQQVLAEFADTESPQGLLAVAEEPRPPLPGDGGAGERVLILDQVQDPGNVGSLVRTAAALGADRILALDGTVDPWNAKVVRASAGLVFHLPLHRIPLDTALAWLQERNLPLLVADAGGIDVRRTDVLPGTGGGFALLLGNEGSGPRAAGVERATAVVALPLAPGVESLNVAMAGGLLLWALGPGGEQPPGTGPGGMDPSGPAHEHPSSTANERE